MEGQACTPRAVDRIFSDICRELCVDRACLHKHLPYVAYTSNPTLVRLLSSTSAGHMSYARGFGIDICYLTKVPVASVGVYVCMVGLLFCSESVYPNSYSFLQLLFDSVATCLILSNALHQPYRRGIQIVWRLRRDGMISYAVRSAAAAFLSKSDVLSDLQVMIGTDSA